MNNLVEAKDITWKGVNWGSWKTTKWDCPDWEVAYLGPNATTCSEDELILGIEMNPEWFSYGEPMPVETGDRGKIFECGWVQSKQTFGYGTFEFEIELPEGSNLLPAVWLTGNRQWPPEIDVMEAFPQESGSYIKNLLQSRLETNLHYKGYQSEHLQTGGLAIPTWWYWLSRLFTKTCRFKLVFHHEFLKIYYNGLRVRYITDKHILGGLSEDDYVIIFNMMINRNFTLKDFDKHPVMKIKNFKYLPI